MQVRNDWVNMVVVGRDSSAMRLVPAVLMKNTNGQSADVTVLHNTCCLFTAMHDLVEYVSDGSQMFNREDIAAGMALKRTLMVSAVVVAAEPAAVLRHVAADGAALCCFGAGSGGQLDGAMHNELGQMGK